MLNGIPEMKSILASCSTEVQNSVPYGNDRFANFERKFDIRFPTDNIEERASAEAITWALFGVPLRLYFIGQNTAVFIELYGFLERYVLRDVPHLLGKDSCSIEIIRSLIERKTLPELSEVLLKKDSQKKMLHLSQN